MKKRIFLSLILVIFSIFSVLALCACKDENNNTETTEQEKVECVHEWKKVSSVLPDCTTKGKDNLTCVKCGERKSVETKPTGHDFIKEWEWAPDLSYASVKLYCQKDESHYMHLSCIVKEEIIEPTCQKNGVRKVSALAIVEGVEYADTKEFDLGIGNCIYKYEFDMSGNSCQDGFDMTATCTECGKKSYASFEDHIIFEMASYTVCGGKSTVRACPCMENIIFDYPSGCEGEVETDSWEETDEGGIDHIFEHEFCVRCDFEVIYDYYQDFEGCYIYTNRKVKIVDGEKELYSFAQNRYETTSLHELEYSYSGGKIDNCENGYIYHVECKKCNYSEDIAQNSHQITFLTSKVSLKDLGACGGYIQEKECPCGEHKEIGYVLVCNYEYDYRTEEQDGVLHTIKTYTCQSCGLEFILDESITENGGEVLCIVKINGEEKYRHTSTY